MRPDSFVRDLQFKPGLNTKIDPVANSHLSDLFAPWGKLLLHLLKPEVHSIIDNFDRAFLNNARAYGRKTEVFACINYTLVIEANLSGMDESSFDQGAAELTCGFELRFAILGGESELARRSG